MASIYVGNLDPECSEAMLFQKFGSYGNLLNIRLIRNKNTGRCLGYGFVDFALKENAETAMNELNYSTVKGRTLRLMWNEKDIKKLPENANVFVKNLEYSLDEKALHTIFANYGEILSLKLAKEENGTSKGHAFIQYADEKSAEDAIKELNGKILFGKIVCVTRFLTKDKRIAKNDKFRNIYIKNFDVNIKDKDLIEMCEKYGDIVSAKVMTDEDGNSKGFGFVCFKSSDSAREATKELSCKIVNGKKLFADRAKSKLERQKEIMENFKNKYQTIDDIISNINRF